MSGHRSSISPLTRSARIRRMTPIPVETTEEQRRDLQAAGYAFTEAHSASTIGHAHVALCRLNRLMAAPDTRENQVQRALLMAKIRLIANQGA